MKHRTVSPRPISGRETTAELLRDAFPAFAGRNLREAFRLMKQSVEEDHVNFLTLSGAMTPAGLHHSCILPLIEAGAIDVITTTGANLYHDIHRSIGFEVHELDPRRSDLLYREDRTVRIYDLGITDTILEETDKFVFRCLESEPFQRRMTTPEFHFQLGALLAAHEDEANVKQPSLLATCYRKGIPIFCGAPQDGSLFLSAMYLTLLRGDEFRFELDVNRDATQMAALQYMVQREQKTAIWIIGGGVPKNYTLQGEPTLSQIFHLEARGFDIDVQVCVDVEDNGALSSCTAGEAHTWGKTSEECVTSNSVYLRTDTTIALPLLTHGLLGSLTTKRPGKRLMDRLEEAMTLLRGDIRQATAEKAGEDT